MKIYLISLESVPSRYTSQWKTHLPAILEEKTGKAVIDIEGSATQIEATPGAFLNFSATNIFKSEQAIKIAELFERGEVADGDIFLFADAWNPVIIMTRYMIDLLGIDAKIHSIWHAGSYDKADLLGQKIANKNWSYSFERSVFFACDKNYFATQFHIDMIIEVLGLPVNNGSIVRTGFPMECVTSYIPKSRVEKNPIVVFPHRLSPEKNIDLFREIKRRSEEEDLGFSCFICQDHKLSKSEYYEVMSKATLMFSANLQETLGLSALDALACDTAIMVPNRLSYKEMYSKASKYEDSVSLTVDDYIAIIQNRIKLYDVDAVRKEYSQVVDKYFTGSIMYEHLS